MVDVKNTFLRLDLDTDFFSLPKEHYVDALNITRDSFSANKDFAATNIVGNRLVNYTLPAGTNRVIGALGVLVRNTVIYCVYNSNSYHSILEYNNSTRSVTKIFENLTDSDNEDILGFNTITLITSMNIYIRDEGDLLFFLDSLGRPTMLNVTRFKNGEYTPVTRQIINLHKMPPLAPPDCVYDNDAAVGTNDTRNKLFKFKYRWIYDDDFKSTWSPISAVPLPASILDPTFTNEPTNNNVIHINMNSGPKNVKQIELAVSFVNKVSEWPIFQSVTIIDKAQESIDDDIAFNYDFYNDATYPFIDVEESNLLFDWIPRYAKAQEMPNGNYTVLAGITEGYDRDLEPNVDITILTTAAGGGGTIGSLNGIAVELDEEALEYEWQVIFSGVPATGTVVNVYIQRASDSMMILAGTYTTLSGDTALDVTIGIRDSMISIGITNDWVVTPSNPSVDYEFFKAIYNNLSTVEIIPPASDTDNDSIATWKWSTSRTLGLVYFDENGVTNGVLYSAKIVFPEYAEDGSQVPLLPYINVKIYHVPPEWAYSYQFVITKEPTTYLFWECIDVNTDETDYLYFDVSNISLNASKNPTVATVLSYSYQDSDRVRLIRRMSDDTVYDDTYDIAIEGQVVDPTINGSPVSGTFIKIKRVAPFSSVDYSSDFFVIEIYRPGKQPPSETNQVFYEFGEQYYILDPNTDLRRHAGAVTDQSSDYVTPAEVNLYNGDSYFRGRTVYISETGFGTFNVQDRNFVDFYTSAVSSVDGRPSVIEINARSAFYRATIRHSEPYQPNTNINGLNRFFPDRIRDCDASFGDIERMKVRDRYIRIFQQLKTGMIPLFSNISKDGTGNEITIQTDNLLNPIQYYVGDYGIGTAAASLASYNYADYFADNIRGGIVRLSQDGNTPISVLYKVNSWAVANLPLRNIGYKMYGAYDQRSNNYILALEEAVLPNVFYSPIQEKVKTFPPYWVFTLAGVPVAGDILSIQLTDGNDVTRTYSYTAQQGDSASDMAEEIKDQINADIYFVAVDQTTYEAPGLKITQVAEVDAAQFALVVTITNSGDVVSPAQTIAFDEETNAFESFLSYSPEYMVSLGTLLISFLNGSIYTHDSSTYNQFYGVDYESSITVVFNDNALIKKSPISITENASKVWDCPTIYSNVNSYPGQRQETNLVAAEFSLLESMPTASVKRDINSRAGKINGDFLKGNWLAVKFRIQDASEQQYLSIIELIYNQSPLNKVN